MLRSHENLFPRKHVKTSCSIYSDHGTNSIQSTYDEGHFVRILLPRNLICVLLRGLILVTEEISQVVFRIFYRRIFTDVWHNLYIRRLQGPHPRLSLGFFLSLFTLICLGSRTEHLLETYQNNPRQSYSIIIRKWCKQLTLLASCQKRALLIKFRVFNNIIQLYIALHGIVEGLTSPYIAL